MKATQKILCCLLIVSTLLLIIDLNCHAQTVYPRKTAKKAIKNPIRIIDSGKEAFELEMLSFEKEKEFLDEPFEFSSTEAEELWNFLVQLEPHLKKDPKEMKFMGGSFARLGSDSYLIEYYAFYFAQPHQGKLTKLTTSLPIGNYDLGEIRKLGQNMFWFLLSGFDYHRDIASKIYYALVIEKKSDGLVVAKAFPIADFAEYGEGLCERDSDPDLDYPTLQSTAHVNNYSIKDINSDGREDIIFLVEEQNCKTKKTRQYQRVFLNQENEFVEKSLTIGGRRSTR